MVLLLLLLLGLSIPNQCSAFLIPQPFHKPISRLLGTSSSVDTTKVVEVGDLVGAGSYGKVHYCTTLVDGKPCQWIGKRPLTLEEVQEKTAAISDEEAVSPKDLKDKVQRCQHYWEVEKHCYTKMDNKVSQLPPFQGSFRDKDDQQWMLFDIITSTLDNDEKKPAPTLTDLMKLDHDKQHDKQHSHHLYYLQKALGLKGDDVSLGETLDAFFLSLLKVLQDVHAQKIVSRDIKPENLLIAHQVYLIDLGSAADLEPGGGGIFGKKYVGLEDDTVVAISPIYAAPEVFVDLHNKPDTFDVFSAALIYCQLLFNFLDERTDAGFHQQLASCDWNLDVWLQQEIASKVRPQGLEEALVVLSERPGLWRLLQEMFRAKPWDRIDSKDALTQLQLILEGKDAANRFQEDGPFLQSVLETFEVCDVMDMLGDSSDADNKESSSEEYIPISRPLHFVASFKRNTPLGLILAEANTDDDDDDEMDEEMRRQWKEATKNALPGQVFVKGIVPDGQADDFDTFEIGDQLQGVGELPVAERGFETVVELLGKQPPSSKYVTLHFDRKRSSSDFMEQQAATSPALESPIFPLDSGAWSAKGRRSSQEDRFVLHEMQDTTGRSVLVAGVFDGHGGTAASNLASEQMPDLISEELFRHKDSPVGEILENAWNTISLDYQQACASDASCIADYDAREGTLDANTGAGDLIAGTTASVAALDESNGNISILNCGDSRTLVVNKEGMVTFQTSDHTPEREMERLKAGKEQGLDYSIPQCSVSRWWLSVGDYQYAVGRSLEGPFATSKGIISEADVTKLQAEPGSAIISASDGLWEVMDSKEVAHIVASVRAKGTGAGDAAKTLCSMAIEKGTSDNVSAVIVYL